MCEVLYIRVNASIVCMCKLRGSIIMYLLLIGLGWYTTPLANLPYYCCKNNSCNSYHDDNNNNHYSCNYWRGVVGRWANCMGRRWRGVGALWFTGRSNCHWAVSIDSHEYSSHNDAGPASSHPGLYQRDEGATVCLWGSLQSGSICQEWWRFLKTGKRLFVQCITTTFGASCFQ